MPGVAVLLAVGGWANPPCLPLPPKSAPFLDPPCTRRGGTRPRRFTCSGDGPRRCGYGRGPPRCGSVGPAVGLGCSGWRWQYRVPCGGGASTRGCYSPVTPAHGLLHRCPCHRLHCLAQEQRLYCSRGGVGGWRRGGGGDEQRPARNGQWGGDKKCAPGWWSCWRRGGLEWLQRAIPFFAPRLTAASDVVATPPAAYEAAAELEAQRRR